MKTLLWIYLFISTIHVLQISYMLLCYIIIHMFHVVYHMLYVQNMLRWYMILYSVRQCIVCHICCTIRSLNRVYIYNGNTSRAIGNVHICWISARWLNLLAIHKKVRVWTSDATTGQTKIVPFLKLRSVRAKLRWVAQNCARCCAVSVAPVVAHQIRQEIACCLHLESRCHM